MRFLADVGLEYLTLDRSAETLSGGEAQRIRLASQIGSGLVGVMYILDEPSIGLHQRDNRRLLGTLTRLRDLGNTVLMVEHDEEAILSADHVVDLGPGAGAHGGEIVAQGTPRADHGGERLDHRPVPVRAPGDSAARSGAGRWTISSGSRSAERAATISRTSRCKLPLGLMTCVTGVSGSGKSTLINDTLYRRAAESINETRHDPAPCDAIEGLEQLDRVIDIDQSPIGRTPRSNPATYTGLFTPMREIYAATQEARSRGYDPGRFSFNVKGGRCEACQGDGVIRVEMHFLPDVYVTCDVCQGRRYNRETLEIRYKGRSINEVLDMTVEDALGFFANVPAIAGKLQTLVDVGLSYVKLGQNATTLSGGEAQRVKLAKELSKRATGQDPLHPGRAHHRPALPRRRPAPRRAAPAARPGQHGGDHRAQSRRDQNRGLDRGPRSRGRGWRRPRRGDGHAGAGRGRARLFHGPVSGPDPERIGHRTNEKGRTLDESSPFVNVSGL